MLLHVYLVTLAALLTAEWWELCADQWEKMDKSYTMGYYLTMERKEMLIDATTKKNLKSIARSERRQ